MNKKLIRLTEGDLHKIVKESVNRVLKENTYNNEYEVDFTFFISLGYDKTEYKESISKKDNLLDLLDTMPEIVNYEVENDGEDWCINCIANIMAKSIKQVDGKMNRLLHKTDCIWDYVKIQEGAP